MKTYSFSSIFILKFSFLTLYEYPTKSYAEVRHYWIWTCRVNLQIYSKSTIPCNYAMTMPAQIHAWLQWFTPRSTNPHSFCKLRENGLLRKTHNVGKYGCVNSFTRRPTLIPNIMWLAIYIFFLIIKYVVNNKIKKMHSLPSLPSSSNFFTMNKACDYRFEPDHISVGPFAPVNQNAT